MRGRAAGGQLAGDASRRRAVSCGAERARARVTRSLGAVAGADVGQALLDGHVLAVRAGGHVAVDQRVGQIARAGFELAGQLVGQAAFARLR